MYFVYILKCRDGKLYIGCTNNIKERINRHNKGLVPATAYKMPVQIKSLIVFPNKYLAFSFEKYLKTGSGRVFTKNHLLSEKYWRGGRVVECVSLEN